MEKKNYETENEFLGAIYKLGRELHEVDYIINSLTEEKEVILESVKELILEDNNGGYDAVFRNVMLNLFTRISINKDRLDFVIMRENMDPGNFKDYCEQVAKDYHFDVIFFNDEINIYGAVFKPDLQVFNVLEEKYKIWKVENLTEEEVDD